jgi:two-component system nitrate/nitrite response regulator NarL
MITSITIVVADNHPIMRAGIQVVDICRELHPDLLLLDIHLAKMEGLMVAHLLQKAYKAPRIIIFSATSNAAIVQAALDTGVSGYVLKNVAGNDLLDAIYRVMRGQKVLLGVDKPQIGVYQSLSVRELLTLRYMADGLSTKEIAWRMSNSTRTIETYINRVFYKLGANNRTQAVAIAHRERLLLTEEG